MLHRLLIVFITFFMVTYPVSAATQSHTELWRMIADLQAHINVLQQQLAAQTRNSVPPHPVSAPDTKDLIQYTSAQSAFYRGPLTHHYEVYDNKLPSSAHQKHIALFQQWHTFAEAAGIRHSVSEMWLYDDTTAYEGFIEWLPESRTWRLGLNENVPANDYATLFTHEIVHIIVSEQPELLADFTTRFWTERDHLHAAAVVAANNQSDRDQLLENYYKRNQQRFVSDYATFSPEEDLAETVAWVIVGREGQRGDSRAAEKQRWVRAHPIFMNLRTALP